MKLYRNFTTQEEIDNQYNVAALTPGRDSWIERYNSDSEKARRTLDCELNIQYGPTLDECLDIFPSPRPGSPVLVYIHGGYWRAQSSKGSSFIAPSFVEQGVTVVIINYSLCPKVSIAEITRQCRATIAWLTTNAERYNGSADEIYVSGHSAGGHLTAMLCSTDWPGDYGLMSDTIKGGIAISGVFDLEPLRFSFLQPVLMLNDEVIRWHSPCLNAPASGPPLLLSVGGGETSEFHRQANDYQALWEKTGMTCLNRVEDQEDHFSILYNLVNSSSSLFEQSMKIITGDNLNIPPKKQGLLRDQP